ncbi:helix-turn-helix domain-containing protein [Paracnuella aquatica]|uniref:helix-turn-helix domain-containing protein n=1 Tax=Paracnuella aquatica TaxID=2268757 RepID=UPI000DEFCAB6|nr:helix-turn-helix domain-containing protein [Paracnuella aquatica]RPD44394.1 DNA-binding protein [Paracnuella aquatica]
MERNDTQILFPYDPQKFWMEMRKLIQEELEGKIAASEKNEADESILQRVEVAKMLRISLVTLNDWVKRGLPSHKQRGKVYFLYSEVMEYLKNRKRPLS